MGYFLVLTLNITISDFNGSKRLTANNDYLYMISIKLLRVAIENENAYLLS